MYQEFFRLRGHPFQLTPDPNVFYRSSGHVRAKSYLTFGLSQGEGFIVVTGDVGAGKTTLLSHMLATLGDKAYKVARVVTSHLNAEDTLRVIVRAFGVEADDHANKAELLHRIETLLVDAAKAGERCLLIVDEVQNMPFSALEELRMLSNIEVPGGKVLQQILVGQPEFRNFIAGPQLEQLRQRVVASCHLSPMEEDEVRDYVTYRLDQAGWQNDPSFDPEAFSEIYRRTGGVPRRINMLCARLLLYACIEECHHLMPYHVIEVADELSAETTVGHSAGGADRAPVPAVGGHTGGTSSTAIPRQVAEMMADHEERLAALEERVRRHDQTVRRALLSLSDFLDDVRAMPPGRGSQ